jgi:transposase
MTPTSITMTSIQLQRFEVLSQLNSENMNGTEASEKLGLSVRQIRRLKKKIKKKGARGLIHGNKGKTNPRKVEKKIRDKVLKLMQGTYKNFGPTFAAEKLAERDDISVSHEWLRLFMITEKLWIPKKKKDGTIHRCWRPRMDLEGAMEQFDGSYHHWLTLLDEELCLLLTIDDATGKIKKARFEKNEGITAVFTFWKEYAQKHGRLPKRLYVDKFSTYKVNHKNAVDDPEMITQFNRALKELGVELICAHSPQAKGRVERVFGTLQDRLVKEMTLAGVKSVEEANVFLQKYIPKFNQQFDEKAAKEGDAYVTILSTTDLDQVFSVQKERRVTNDYTVQFETEWYQIEKEQSVMVLRRDTVTVEKRLDGSVRMRLIRSDKYLNIRKLPMRPIREKMPRCTSAVTRTPHVPAANHPWGYRANHRPESLKVVSLLS